MRSVVVSDWLATTDWAGWDRVAMTGDASARSYERLSNNAQSVILMNAPPETCGNQSRFVEIAAHLRALNLAAPDVLAWDETLGLMVLSDLGQSDFARQLRTTPQDEAVLYGAAIDVLHVLQSAPPPNLTKMSPDVGADMIGLAFEWAATDKSVDLALEITSQLQALLRRVDPDPKVLSLRDFHAENLIWRPEQSGMARVGLLDFQDAFVTHPTYDLASLLRDARRDVAPDLLPVLIQKLAGPTGDINAFSRAFHVMAVQRNLRILGIFQRLAFRDGKTEYLNLLPRVWAHLRTDLAAEPMTDIAPLIMRAFAPKVPSS